MPAKQTALSEREIQAMPLMRAWHEKSRGKYRTLQRKKLWELQSRFHCSVIGTCLTLDELRRLCRKANIIFETPVSDHELHGAFVNIAGESTYPSRLLQKHLDSKYKRIIQQFLKIRSAGELQLLWAEAMKTGEVAGAFWALATHPCTPDEFLDQMYGDIHMLSHLAGASVRVDMQELTRQRRRAENLEAQLTKMRHDANRKLKDKDETIQTMSERLVRALAAEQRLQQAEQRLTQLESGAELLKTRNQIETLSARLTSAQARKERAEAAAKEWKQLAKRSEDRNLRLERALAEARQERDALETSLVRLLSGNYRSACAPEGEKTDPNPDLRGRCILYVGGRTGQSSHFRALVERCNGRYIHHDGGREDGRLHLGSILPRADAVLCPLDCVSHDAVRRVKRFCNRHGKPLVLLPRGSLSAFARGLAEAAA